MLSAGALALAATPASARDGAWYVGGDFGAMIVEDSDFDFSNGSTTVDNALTLNHDYGYDGALFVGYDLGAFRLEAEVAYKSAGLDSFENSIVLPSTAGPHPVGKHDAGGHTSALSFMINGLLDFGNDDGVSGFVGGGLGSGHVKISEARFPGNDGVFLDDGDSAFAWQVIAGIRHAVSDNVDVTLKYRFFNVGDVRFVTEEPPVDDAHGHFRSHSLLAGITFNFGAPPPPP
jgi:opacity protein-like surface antigen